MEYNEQVADSLDHSVSSKLKDDSGPKCLRCSTADGHGSVYKNPYPLTKSTDVDVNVNTPHQTQGFISRYVFIESDFEVLQTVGQMTYITLTG